MIDANEQPGCQQRFQDGFTFLQIRNDSVAVTVVPELGAKIISLQNCATKREWMWQAAPQRPLFRNKVGDDFAASTLAGWDECLPTVAPCHWRGRHLPDHGEVWSAACSWDEAAWKNALIKTRVELPLSPFVFERTVSLSGNCVRLDYSLTNHGSQAEEFIWAMHPLLELQPGDGLILPGEARRQWAGENWINTLDFGLRQPACAKVFAAPITSALAGVANERTGDRLEISWDKEVHFGLGLWLTRGGWKGCHHLALEPTNGLDDSLVVAVREKKTFGLLVPRETRRWKVEVRLRVDFSDTPNFPKYENTK